MQPKHARERVHVVRACVCVCVRVAHDSARYARGKAFAPSHVVSVTSDLGARDNVYQLCHALQYYGLI